MRLLSLLLLLAPVVHGAAIELTPLEADPGDQYKVKLAIDAEPEWPLDGVVEVQFDAGSDGSAYVIVLEALQVRLLRRAAGGEETVLAQDNRHPPIGMVPLDLVITRDRWRIRVIGNDQVWLTAYDDQLPAGGVAYGTNTAKLTITEPLLQPTEAVWFSDDFMRDSETTGDWQPLSGNWTMSGVSEADAKPQKRPDPTLSANPFAFRVAKPKDPALAQVGHWFWDTYRTEASVRAAGDGSVGLCFYVKDPENYLLFRWRHSARGDERQLVAVRDGQEEVLARADGGWANDQWYRLAVEIVDDHVIASIDGIPVLETETTQLGQGAVALWADDVTFADFDDVEVIGTENVVHTFAQPTRGRWDSAAGTWSDEPSAEGLRDPGLRISEGGDGLSLTGSTQWRDYRVSATVRAGSGGGLGLVACYQDEANLVALRWGDGGAPPSYRGKLQLVALKQGQEQVLGEIPVAFKRSLWHELSLETQSGFLRGRIGGVPVFEWFDPELSEGKVGLLAANRAVEFDQVDVEFLPPAPTIEFTTQFTKEDTMSEWAQAAGSWEVAEAKQRQNMIWHRGEFRGDSQLTLDATMFGEAPRTVKLVLAGTKPGAAPPPAPPLAAPAEAAPPGPEPGLEQAGKPDPDGGGYALVLVQQKPKSTKVIADLQIDGQSVRRAELDSAGAEQIRFQRRGRFLLGYLDQACVLGYHDARPQPANGLHVALAGLGSTLDLERVDARCDSMFDTSFVQAPVEWYVGKGIWETINRWKCDPRWSFFGGYDDPNPVIWSKEGYQGDIQVEAYMSIKMDLPGPPHYSHPSDLCLTIGGNGTDLLSGYTFLYAAENNTSSLLYRHGEQIGRNTSKQAVFEYVGPKGEGLTRFHRHWFHLVFRRANGRVTASVDDQVLFDVADDGSVPGGKIALFSVNNGMMVSRVKVWYSEKAPREDFPDVGALQAGMDGQPGDPFATSFEQHLGGFAQDDPRAPVLLETVGGGASGPCLQVTNLRSGGTFGVRALDQPFAVSERGKLRFKYKLPPEARINLYVRARETWHVIQLTGGAEVDNGQKLLGKIDGATADDTWHAAEFDLAGALGKLYPKTMITVQRILFGMMEPQPYLQAGFGVNRFGLSYRLDDFALVP